LKRHVATVPVTTVAIVMGLLVVGALVAYTYIGQPTVSGSGASSQPSSATPTAEWSTFNSTVSQSGLRLQIRLNATTLQVGKGLSAGTYLFNTLSRNVSLSPDFSMDAGLVAMSRNVQCGGAGLDGMLASAVYQGHYTASNFSHAAVPLMLEPPVPHGCPAYYYQDIQEVEFAPNSDVATVFAMGPYCANGASCRQTVEMHISAGTGNCTAVPYRYGSVTIVVNGSTTTSSGGTQLDLAWPSGNGLTGYWTTPSNGTYVTIDMHSNATVVQGLDSVYQHYYHGFTPGSYTLVAEDLWNQTVFASFIVEPPAQTISNVSQTFSRAGISASIANSSIDLQPGQPFRLVAKISSPVDGPFLVGVASRGTDISPGIIDQGHPSSLPAGLSAEFPFGATTQSGSQAEVPIVIIAASNAPFQTIPLQLVVYQQQGPLDQPGAYSGVVIPFNVSIGG
jgi:hypothetical protein